MNKTLILKARQIERLKNIKGIIRSVEAAFAEYASNQAQMPPKVYLDLKQFNGDFRAMPAFLGGQNAASLKWVNVHPGNKRKNLPTVMGVIILSDPKTGFPLSIMDGTLITKWRTAASSAIATKYLAHEKSKVLSVLGCGAQSYEQIIFNLSVRKFKKIHLWDINKKAAERLKRMLLKSKVAVEVFESVKACVGNADVIITITPSRKPIVKRDWIKDGVHINAIGADAKGKRELSDDIIKSANLIIDDWAQASHSGEINVPLSKKVICPKDIVADIGSVVLGRSKGRRRVKDITVFDSTGLAIQDTAVAQLIYKSAKKSKLGTSVQLI